MFQKEAALEELTLHGVIAPEHLTVGQDVEVEDSDTDDPVFA